jgi:hypothetical protein
MPNVKNIYSQAFEECKSLLSITIPSSCENINSFAFAMCESLTTITILSNAISIGSNAFYNCSSLTTITMPFTGITYILLRGDYYHFWNCPKLSTIHFIWGDGNPEIDLRLLLPDSSNSESIDVYKQINHIDLRMPNGNNPIGKSLKISYCGLKEESIVLNTSNNWTWKYVQQ